MFIERKLLYRQSKHYSIASGYTMTKRIPFTKVTPKEFVVNHGLRKNCVLSDNFNNSLNGENTYSIFDNC